MLAERTFSVTLGVPNPIHFCADKEAHVRSELAATYVGRCYQGCYIASVKEVLDVSSCRIVKTNTSGEGSVDVTFVAWVAVYSRWDILVGVEIVSQQQMIVGRYIPEPGARMPAQAVVSFVSTRLAESYALKQRVPARILTAQHNPMKPGVTVAAIPLTCDNAAQTYRLQGALDAGAAAGLRGLLDAIGAELGKRAELVRARRDDVWFFELLLCHYRAAGGAPAGPDQRCESQGAPAWEGPPAVGPPGGGEAQNVLDIVRRALGGEAVPVAGYWARPLTLCRSSPLAARAATLPAGWQLATASAPAAVFADFLKSVLDFLGAVREMTELYNTKELIGSHRNVWTAMRAAQKAA